MGGVKGEVSGIGVNGGKGESVGKSWVGLDFERKVFGGSG